MGSKVKRIDAHPLLSVEESDKLEGVLLNSAHCQYLLKDSVDVFDTDSGKCIAKYRRQVIPGEVLKAGYDALLEAATPTDSRGVATGAYVDGLAKGMRIRKDGSKSRQDVTHVKVNSGVIGFSDRSPRFTYCRLTAFNQHNFNLYRKALPIIKDVDKLYRELMPKEYKKQKEAADNSSQDFIIEGTAFSTVTVNKNWQTAVHKDKGDFKEGFGNLVALRSGSFHGGYFVLPRWGIGFDLRNGDVLLVDVHQWHGNTPIYKDSSDAVRLSLVMYYREGIKECGSIKEEVKRVKARKRGDKLKF